MSILKRLDAHVAKDRKDKKSQGGQQTFTSILVKVFQTYVNPALEEGEHLLHTDECGDSEAGFDDGRSTKSKSKALSHVSAKTAKGEADKKKRERALLKDQQDAIDNDPRSQKYQFCFETFRISKITDIKTFQRIVCEHWGLETKDFAFYDDNGDILEAEDMGNNGSRPVEKVMETLMVKELKDKDLLPPGPRRSMLYLGCQKFEEKFKKVMQLKREKFEEEKAQKKLLQGLDDAIDDDNDQHGAFGDNDVKVDREANFLC